MVTINSSSGISISSGTYTYSYSINGSNSGYDWISEPTHEIQDRNGNEHLYSYNETLEILTNHMNEKILREENPLLNEAYKKYKMLLKIYNSVDSSED